MKLVIVESPAKAKTIAKYLGEGFKVDASRGHILDLPVKSIGVDIKNNYKPDYQILTDDQRKTIDRLKSEVQSADEVFLATDPDREGEAISWHLQTALNLDPKKKNRIMFNEISKTAVNKAIQNPDYVNMNLVDAQQARRVLDRLVGYTVSPVLCRKIQNKLSAGRVQSAALRILVDREKEITSFKPEEYWNVSAFLEKHGVKPSFKALLTEKQGKKFKIKNAKECEEVLGQVKANDFVVSKVKRSTTKSHPFPPFTTSTLQQDAVNKLKFGSSQTMQIAQQLYEGIDIADMGHVALVTYIRTDSVRVSDEAIANARKYIGQKYGAKYVPAKPNYYSTKKDAQDAHEAIRPINLDLTPESLKSKLQKNQYLLYKLIYERFLASQSVDALFDSLQITACSGDYGFSASGKTLIFDGYTAIYAEAKKEKDEDDETSLKLPNLDEGDKLDVLDIKSEQKFTKPPIRFTEASIIKQMEERGIGRPSTYATIMATLYKREYIAKDGKYLKPTELGIVVTDYLSAHFASIVDVEFTAEMESRLDSIEEKGVLWYNIVDEFYKPLEAQVHDALNAGGMHVADQPCDELCEKCNSPMVIKTGRYGKYYACTNPDCRSSRSVTQKSAPKQTDVKCEKCGAPMLEREGRFGKYLACSNYPNCKNTRSIDEVVGKCPECGKDVVKRLSKKGKVFFSCTGYPKCNFASWDIPTGQKCPQCGSYLIIKETKNGKTVLCSDKNCNYREENK